MLNRLIFNTFILNCDVFFYVNSPGKRYLRNVLVTKFLLIQLTLQITLVNKFCLKFYFYIEMEEQKKNIGKKSIFLLQLIGK